MDINLSQEKVLSMIGEREVKIAFLNEQVIRMSVELGRLKARVDACTCVAKIPVAVPSDGAKEA